MGIGFRDLAKFGGFPKLGVKNEDTFLWVPKMRIIAFWGLYWGPLLRETTIEGLVSSGLRV